MNNRFKEGFTGENVEQGAMPELKEKAELPRNFFTLMFTEGIISREAATNMLPFIIYVAFLGIVYIGNQHFAVKNVRKIDKLNKEVKELSWDYKTLKADLMLKSTQTEVAKLVDTLGLKELVKPPTKIVIAADEY